MAMRLYAFGSAAILALSVAGCAHDCFQLEIRPDGQAFQRRLTAWHMGGADGKEISRLPAEQLARLAKLYPCRESPQDAAKQVFSGRFAATTPADLGGAGSYTHFTSPLGSTSSYAERFRGDDDLESNLARRRQGADQLADLLLGWLTAELGRDPAFPRLKKFLDQDLRLDLKNLGVYAWTGGVVTDDQAEPNGEFFARVGLYLSERGYFSPQQIPMLARAAVGRDISPLLAHIQRFAARKMGLPDGQPIPRSLAFLGDPERLGASLDTYVRSTALFRQRVAQWQAARIDKPDAKEPSPGSLMTDLAAQAVVGHNYELTLGVAGDILALKLICGQQPYATNGRWSEPSGTVSWSETMGSDRRLPVVCFALWSSPARTFQEQHFGRVLLAGGDLAQYVVWYRSLKAEEAGAWDRFLAGLKPGAGLKGALERFRFSTDPQPDPREPHKTPPSLADTPRRLLLDKLAPKDGKPG
jgi:hypothetical protein